MIFKNKIIIVDLEATCWDKGQHSSKNMEIIEIGAVKVYVNDLQIVDEYDAFIKPIKFPILSDFCKELTTIKQEDVDSADEFPRVWQSFLDWIGDYEDVSIASWGAYDKIQMLQDCILHKLKFPFNQNHINLKKWFSGFHNGKKYGMKRALNIVGLDLIGNHHRGIDDAKNIWRIVEKIIK